MFSMDVIATGVAAHGDQSDLVESVVLLDRRTEAARDEPAHARRQLLGNREDGPDRSHGRFRRGSEGEMFQRFRISDQKARVVLPEEPQLIIDRIGHVVVQVRAGRERGPHMAPGRELEHFPVGEPGTIGLARQLAGEADGHELFRRIEPEPAVLALFQHAKHAPRAHAEVDARRPARRAGRHGVARNAVARFGERLRDQRLGVFLDFLLSQHRQERKGFQRVARFAIETQPGESLAVERNVPGADSQQALQRCGDAGDLRIGRVEFVGDERVVGGDLSPGAGAPAGLLRQLFVERRHIGERSSCVGSLPRTTA